jgi:hypothetical protein
MTLWEMLLEIPEMIQSIICMNNDLITLGFYVLIQDIGHYKIYWNLQTQSVDSPVPKFCGFIILFKITIYLKGVNESKDGIFSGCSPT